MSTGKVKSSENIQDAPEQSPAARSRARRPDAEVSQPTFDAAPVPQMAGNLAVQRLFRAGAIQAKLGTSQPGDADEQEADSIAERVVTAKPSGTIQRKCAACAGGATCPKCEAEHQIQPKEKPGQTAQADSQAASQITSLRGGGQPLPASVRAFFEPRFRRDFSRVRVHTDSPAAESAEAINARAYTLGQDVVFGAGEYAPTSAEGQRLLAHELAHVTQQERSDAAPRIQRQPPKGQKEEKPPVNWRPGMFAKVVKERILIDQPRYAESAYKVGEIIEVTSEVVGFYRSPSVETVLAPLPGRPRGTSPRYININLIEPVDASQVPVDQPVIYMVVPVGTGTDVEPGAMCTASEPSGIPGAVPGLTMGGGRGVGFVYSPPIRNALDPLLPSWVRTRNFDAPLGRLPGGDFRLERYVGVDILEQLQPRYRGPEGQRLAELEYFRRSTPGFTPPEAMSVAPWADRYNVSHQQLGEVRNLLARAATDGLETLTDAERALLLTVVDAHARGGLVAASPLLSGSVRPGVSLVEGIPATISGRPYLVQLELPPNAPVGDVGQLLGEAQRIDQMDEFTKRLLQEGEQVFDPVSGTRIRAVQVNPSSALGRTMSVVRHLGPFAEAAGFGYSGYRIATASEEERPRVIGEEVGGQAGGYAGSAGGVAFCIFFGIATAGWGLLGCAVVGGVAGGIGGSYLGGEAGQAFGGTLGTAGAVFGPMIEKSIWGSKPIPEMGYYPPRQFGDNPFEYEEEKKRYMKSLGGR